MINLSANSRLTKWFVWSCDHLPLTTSTYRDDDNREHWHDGAFYVSAGTTLCHIFWAMMWVPLIIITVAGMGTVFIAMIHIEGHYEFVAQHPDYSPALQAASYFIPEIALIGAAFPVLIVILAIIGGSKSGFFSLLWQYLRGVKQRVCPLVHFESAQ